MSLGEVLRSAREQAGLSLDQLSSQTSIRSGLLQEMESDRFTGCGGDTYARGHLRTIAAKLRIDSKSLIEIYNEEHSSEHQAIQDALIENNVIKIPRETKNISWKSLSFVAVAIIFIVGLAQIVITNSKPVTVPVVQKSMTPTPPPTPTSQMASPSESAAPRPTQGLTLVISATRGNSNVDIVSEGVHLYKGPLFQGDVRTFQGKSSISIYLGNAGDLDLNLNGQPLAPLGDRNQEVRKTFRATL